MSKNEKTCPSSTKQIGANLLGIVNEDGSVGYFSQPILIDEEFNEVFNEMEDVESKYRFSNTCVNKGCKQWANDSCTVISKVMHQNDHVQLEQQLPDCSIRQSCRWYYQEGAKACSFCPFIITDLISKTKREVM